MRRSLLLLSLLLVGCHKSREAELVGTWKTSSGITSSMTADGGMVKTIGRLIERGKWTLDGNTVTEILQSLDGTPIATVKERMQRRYPNPPPRIRALIEDMDKPNVYTLSADGKTLTTDKTKDTNSGGSVTYHKA